MQKIGMIKVGEFDHPNVQDGSILKEHVLYQMKNK
jgi:ribosomal-protein-alanine N-acetyltransferase